MKYWQRTGKNVNKPTSQSIEKLENEVIIHMKKDWRMDCTKIFGFSNRFDLLFSKVADPRLPAIHLDQTNALKHLCCRPDSFICDFYTRLVVFDDNQDQNSLQWKSNY